MPIKIIEIIQLLGVCGGKLIKSEPRLLFDWKLRKIFHYLN